MPAPAPSGLGQLDRLLGSAARSRLLEAFVGAPDRGWSIREIAHAAGVDYKSAWKELAKLRELGVVATDSTDGRNLQRWNRSHPVAAHLESLVNELADSGVVRVVREHLAGLAWVVEAWLFGSVVKRTHRHDSDVDLVLVGDVTEEEALRDMEPLQQRLLREVDYRVYSPRVFAARREQPGFLSAALEGSSIRVKRREP